MQSDLSSLPKGIQRKFLLDLSPSEFIGFCSASKNILKEVCNDDFWRLKIERDFPDHFLSFQKKNLVIKNPKRTYIRLFTDEIKHLENLFGEKDPTIIKIIKETFDSLKKSPLFIPYMKFGKNQDMFKKLVNETLSRKFKEANKKIDNEKLIKFSEHIRWDLVPDEKKQKITFRFRLIFNNF